MALTIGNWTFIIIVALSGFLISLLCFSEMDAGWGIGTLLGAFLLCFIIAFGLSWWNTHTALGVRAMKDYESIMNNGIEREITITAEDGREIFYYEGKCDIELDDNYILFEGEDGLRRIVRYGIQDTVLIIEKAIKE